MVEVTGIARGARHDECPTNGRNSLLYNRNTNTPSKCSLLNRDSWEFIGCDDYPEVHDCIAGLCCPTRALTCIQPMDAGYSSAGNFTTTRWYHDPISYSCQSFQFAGAGGNSNNFPTKVHCESYCLSNFICSEFGAVSPELIPQDSFLEVVPYSSGSQREGQRPVTRWYWNRTKKDCLPFVFFGQGGNFNNFLTKEHCSNFCSVALCPLGSPLLQSSGSPALCTSSAECPYPYFCHSGRCCPSSESVCNQPMSEGVPCLAAPLPRFWFNASAGNCQRFIYNGCQGNSNSFQSLEACQKACEGVEAEPRCPHGSALRIKYGKLRRCGANSFETECPMNYECVHDGTASGCCPTAEYICSLPRNSGRSCKQTPTLRWYFDGIASSCRSFLFHGCDGNINNFPTKQICDEFCPRTALSCPYGGEYHRRGNGEAVECSSDKQCPFNYFCTTMSRRGTELRLCCPTRLSICSQGKDEGINCGQPATRYFFDKFTQQCRPMHFLGCGGNSNNFPSKEICYNFCLSSEAADHNGIYDSM
ncbi:hypothetical protein Y032_0094g2708 [Ancylostoma ceylanicum]|uniref:BPTI/Kunitz inhibitor domain-containing protein n=1 Tax=Ancylostoma ceylanicum TaxID=53326 RepID=A0A016TL95_9BILA|nr:hypothetical protein Y032_0094g2708 [Ancylostoma ceylanicum]